MNNTAYIINASMYTGVCRIYPTQCSCWLKQVYISNYGEGIVCLGSGDS